MYFWLIFDDDEIFALRGAVSKFGDRRRPVGEEPFPIFEIYPCAGHHARAVARADFVLHKRLSARRARRDRPDLFQRVGTRVT